MIIHGDDKGSIGLLLSIDGADGVVKLENRPESRDEITMTNIKLLCKVPNNQAVKTLNFSTKYNTELYNEFCLTLLGRQYA